MTTLRKATQQALEALLTYEQYIQPLTNVFGGPRVPEEGSASAKVDAAINALRAALAEPVQEPVAWYFEARHIDSAWAAAVTLKHPGPEGKYMRKVTPLYTAPPQRKPLTEEEIIDIGKEARAVEGPHILPVTFARAIERAHGIGGSE